MTPHTTPTADLEVNVTTDQPRRRPGYTSPHDLRNNGHKCAAPDCVTTIYVDAPLCQRCKRRTVNVSPNQRDDGTFVHAGGAA